MFLVTIGLAADNLYRVLAANAFPCLTLRPSWRIAVLAPPLISHGSPVTPNLSLKAPLHTFLASPAGAVLFTIAIPLFVGRIARRAMCNFFADGDVEIEERPRRYPNEPRRTRLSFVRPNERSSPRHSGEIEVYHRPRSSGTVVVNHPREDFVPVHYEEPPPTFDPGIPVPPPAPYPPGNPYYEPYQPAYHHHSRSNSSSDYSRRGLNRRHSNRTSFTHSRHDSDDPIILVESSPQNRVRMPRTDRDGRRVVTTTTRRSGRESRYHDDDDRDSFLELPRRFSVRSRDHDDDRDSWTEERRTITRRGNGGRSGSMVRLRHNA